MAVPLHSVFMSRKINSGFEVTNEHEGGIVFYHIANRQHGKWSYAPSFLHFKGIALQTGPLVLAPLGATVTSRN